MALGMGHGKVSKYLHHADEDNWEAIKLVCDAQPTN